MKALLADILGKIKGIKGSGWTSFDTLRSIGAEVRDINRTAVSDAVVFDTRTYTRDMIFSSLKIGKAGMVDASGYDVIILGDLTIRSGRFKCRNLYVYGNIDIDREAGDSSYSNVFQCSKVFCSGNYSAKYTLKTQSSLMLIGGNYTEFDSGINTTTAEWNATPYFLYVLGFLTKQFSVADSVWGSNGATNFICRVNGAVSLINTLIKTAQTTKISAGGALTLSGVKVDDTYATDVFACNYVGTKTGSFDYSWWNSAPAGNHTETASIGILHAPGKPAPTTADGATASTLAWNIPTDINNDTLQFRIEVEEKYNDLSFVKIIDQTTLSDPSRFSGTKPYAQGTGSVTYTIPAATLVSGKTYRWRITAQKNPDATVTSLPSEWRAFVYA
ncbi:hypothetical protein [Desulforegula conservatrix]|uniref:hypothetical protein n=1 Tax=Desulforegula conservatrix TaxID=153026 RepID=UPI000426680F|nr:hypothetical protein [Desulforegula conservatrix]